MFKKIALATGLVLAFAGAAQAQSSTTCPCDANATRISTQAGLISLLSNKMACATVGNEVWQEWHNGSTSGALIDYKLGPSDPRDPSAQVGTFTIGTDATVSYTYGSSTYKYAVCQTGGGPFTFCGSTFGGRDITGAKIGGAGLSSCVGVSNTNFGVSRTNIRN